MGFFSDLIGGVQRKKVSIPPPGPEETQLRGDLAGIVANLRKDLERVRTFEDLDAAVAPIFDLQARRGGEAIQERAIELAGRRGLSLTDTPIAIPTLKAQREFSEGLAAARASAVLDLNQRAIANRLALGDLSLGGVSALGSIRTRQPSIVTRDAGQGLQNIERLIDLAGAGGSLLKKAGSSGVFSLFSS